MFSWRSSIVEPVPPNPAADAFAATIRPGDLAPAATAPVETGARALGGFLASGAFHGAALAATLILAVAGQSAPPAEIPVEIVVEAQPQAQAEQPKIPPAGQAAPAPQEPPAPDPAVAGPPPPPAPLARAESAPAEPAPAEPPPVELAPEPAPRVAAIEPAPPQAAPVPDPETVRRAQADENRRQAAKQAKQAASEAAEEKARERAEKRRLEEKRRARAAARVRHETETRDRPEQAPAPVRLAARAPVGAAGLRDDFDAGAYRAVVARAVSAAVGSTCPGAGAGRVVVALSIAASGRIAGAALTRPSGDAAFDSAALAAVRRAGPFPPPAGRAGVNVPVAVNCR